jgi:hypothetical protein
MPIMQQILSRKLYRFVPQVGIRRPRPRSARTTWTPSASRLAAPIPLAREMSAVPREGTASPALWPRSPHRPPRFVSAAGRNLHATNRRPPCPWIGTEIRPPTESEGGNQCELSSN